MIAEEDPQGQVPAGQVAQVFRDNLGIDLVEQVRQQNNQRTFPAPLLELHERPIIPRLDRFGEHIVDRMHLPLCWFSVNGTDRLAL